MTPRYCPSCENVQPEESLVEYREDDVNWSELRCACGGLSELEEVSLDWSLGQIQKAYTLIRLMHKDDPYWMDVAARLSAAEDFIHDEQDK